MSASHSESDLSRAASRWLAQCGIRAESLSALRGDVSLRRYIRIQTAERSAIVAVYPSQIRPSCEAFLTTTRLLAQAGVRVPEVLACDCTQGFMLLEDLGDQTLYDLHGEDPQVLKGYFWRAVADIERLQSIDPTDVESIHPPLDGALLRYELDQTKSRLLGALDPPGSEAIGDDLDRLFDAICGSLDVEPSVPCHRDFMARNLVPIEPVPNLAVLDHQDLRLGPIYYDLASVLNDSLFPAPELEEEILARIVGHHVDDRLRYHRAAAQRTLKATGTYLMFAARGFDRHQKLVPKTLQRALRHLGHLPEASSHLEPLQEALQPLLRSTTGLDG